MTTAGVEPADEPLVIDVLRDQLAAGGAFPLWLLSECLPIPHPLRASLADTPSPQVVRVDRPAPDTLDVWFEHPTAGWRLLVIITARIATPLTRAQHDAVRARGQAAKEGQLASGYLAVILGPRRFVRDSGNAHRFTQRVTTESLADWLRERAATIESGNAGPNEPPHNAAELRSIAARLREGAEHQVRVAADSARAAAERVWGDYDALLQPYKAHLRVEKRPPTPGSDVLFTLSPLRRVEHLPVIQLRHAIREHRAALDVLGLGESAPQVAARLRDDIPMDLFIDLSPRALTLWLRLPPLDLRSPLAQQAGDLRHAFGALWRLKNWYLSTLDRWAAWRGLASPQSSGDLPRE
ncbi:MAG: hypothetical protein DYG92_12345 [Leptolyngbya sp. PLA1]|nr:hypothetical protein [Leptolyngbya sp. PLA1]